MVAIGQLQQPFLKRQVLRRAWCLANANLDVVVTDCAESWVLAKVVMCCTHKESGQSYVSCVNTHRNYLGGKHLGASAAKPLTAKTKL